MRPLLPIIFAIAFVASAHADEPRRKEAYVASAFLAALSFECEQTAGIENFRQAARDDAQITLEAAGYTEGEAREAVSTIYDSLQSSFEPTGMSPAMCAGMAKQMFSGRDAFRAKLRAE